MILEAQSVKLLFRTIPDHIIFSSGHIKTTILQDRTAAVDESPD